MHNRAEKAPFASNYITRKRVKVSHGRHQVDVCAQYMDSRALSVQCVIVCLMHVMYYFSHLFFCSLEAFLRVTVEVLGDLLWVWGLMRCNHAGCRVWTHSSQNIENIS